MHDKENSWKFHTYTSLALQQQISTKATSQSCKDRQCRNDSFKTCESFNSKDKMKSHITKMLCNLYRMLDTDTDFINQIRFFNLKCATLKDTMLWIDHTEQILILPTSNSKFGDEFLHKKFYVSKILNTEENKYYVIWRLLVKIMKRMAVMW